MSTENYFYLHRGYYSLRFLQKDSRTILMDQWPSLGVSESNSGQILHVDPDRGPLIAIGFDFEQLQLKNVNIPLTGIVEHIAIEKDEEGRNTIVKFTVK